MKGKTKLILVLAVKRRHRANGVLETLRFEDENDRTMSRRFDLKVFRVFSKNRNPGKLHCTRKFSTVIYIEGG